MCLITEFAALHLLSPNYMCPSDYQFDSEDADIVLQTTDGGSVDEFCVHTCILAAASPFFRDMFKLPQGGKIIVEIPVSESSTVLDTLLRFVYPIPDPTITSFEELAPVLEAAIKYDFIAVINALRKQLISPHLLQTSPIRVYALACRYELDEESKIASRYTLGINMFDGPPMEDLRYITGYSYHRLFNFHRQRSKAAQNLLQIPTNIKCMQCNGSVYTLHGSPKWWFEFEKAAKAELAVRPTTDVIFGMEFLFNVTKATECSRCPESVLDSWKFLRDLKGSIDALPATL
jgi:BTB/POZ domain